jgi:dephospho-CoA kinase
MTRMLRVGLTGGIGAGKSTVATRLAEHGAVLIDADRLAREVVKPGTPGLTALVEAFGEQVLAPDGTLNRPALAAVAFADADARARLNGIVHPLVGGRTAELLAAAADDAVVVHDVPLLVENGLAPMYHLVIVVDAAEDVRVKRIVEDRGMTEADAHARIAAQASDEQRRAVADVWLDNSGAVDEVQAAVDALWADRLVPYEANVRLHRVVEAPPQRRSDPTWPAQAQRLIDRVRFVAGERVVAVDHVGPTAAGEAAQDVIELRLTVSTVDDAVALRGPLADAGFPPLPDDDHVHGSADPGRPARLILQTPAA